MNKALFLLLFIFSLVVAQAQDTPRRVLGNFVHKGQVYNFDFAQDDVDSYSLFLSKLDFAKPKFQATGTENISASSATSTTVSTGDSATYFSEFSKSVFDRIFFGQMQEKFGQGRDSSLKDKSAEVFFKIKARLEFIDDEPTTAYFILRKDNIYSFLKENPGGYYNGRLARVITRHNLHKVLIETEDGTIKNIKANVVEYGPPTASNQSPRRFLEFKNQFPISISGKFDSERFANINLYCTNCNGVKGLSRFMKLSDLIIFDILFENEKEDYSPVNKVISLAPNNPIVEVRKEKRSKILDVSAYTDFVGLSQDDPNGLIQFEVKRKITINSTHRQIGAKKKQKVKKDTTLSKASSSNITTANSFSQNYDPNRVYTMEEFVDLFDLSDVDDLAPEKATQSGNIVYYRIKPERGKSNGSIGLPDGVWIGNNTFKPKNGVWFNNVEFKIQFLKLEENNRYIQSATQDVQQPDVYKLRPIDLYKYQLTSIGPVLDVYKVNYTQLKFSWNVLHIGLNWFGVRVIDPTVTTPATGTVTSIFLNNIVVQPGTSLTFRPDSRWGLTIGIAYLNQAIWSQQFSIDNTNGLLQYYLNAYHKFSENTRLFFRFRLTHEVDYRYQNFTQIQLGYNVDLFDMKRKLPVSN